MLKKLISSLIMCSVLLCNASFAYADTINNKNTITTNNLTQSILTSSKIQTGWFKEDNNHYKYYENGQALTNTWKEFDEGYRHFNENGYMDFNKFIDGLQLPEDGLYKKSNDYTSSPKYLFMHLKPETYYGVSGQYAYGDLQYITNTFDVFGIKYEIKYENTYNINENNKILSIQNEYNNFSDNSSFNSKKIIVVSKYAQRVS